jgi:hypothetical protein
MNSFFIILYLVVLVTITSFALLKANLKNWQRVGLFLIAFWAASAYYFHIDTLRGYATSTQLGESDIVAVEIKKPNSDDSGGIYIWAYEKTKERSWIDTLYGINSNYVTPRSFRLDYTKENARKFENIRQKMRQGNIVTTKRKKSLQNASDNDTHKAEEYVFVITDPSANLKDQ